MNRIASTVTLAKIGKYIIEEKIGQGGMGTVYRGHDPSTDATVAIKVMPAGVMAEPLLRARFAKECQIARKLNHPNIVRVLDFGLDCSKPFMVMEHVDGEPVAERIQRDGRLPEAEAIRIIVQAGKGLHYAHENKLVHRDVKPDNILLTSDGVAKVSDLGLVKNLRDQSQLTRPKSCLGTPNFMAPEQFKDATRCDALNDLYSLAASLYMIVTGELPFRARTPYAVQAILNKKLNNELTPPRTLAPELSRNVEQQILKALQVDRSKRHASVLEFVEALTAEPLEGSPEPAEVLPPTDVSCAGKKENRAKRRFASGRSTSCQAVQRTPDAPWFGHVVNISQNGLCLELNRRFERGSLLSIVLEADRIKRRSLIATVIWVRQKGKVSWKMGCRLDQPLSEFEVHELR